MAYKLHAVIINKSVPLGKAKIIASDIIKDKNKKFYRETTDSWRFRNIPKTKFKDSSFIKDSSFRSKVINKDITLVFGELK